MWNRKDAWSYMLQAMEAVEWGECKIDNKSFQWDPFNYLVRGHLLTEQPNTYWFCDISTVYVGDEVIEVNIDLKLKQNRKCIDKAYYTIYVDKEGGVDRIEQK